MKTFLIIAFLIISSFIFSSCNSSLTDDKTAPKEYIYNINLDSLSEDIIFDRIELWISNNFVYDKTGITYKNKNGGLIVANGRTVSSKEGIYFTLTVNVENNKAILQFNNIQSYYFFEDLQPDISSEMQVEIIDVKKIFDDYKVEITNFIKNQN